MANQFQYISHKREMNGLIVFATRHAIPPKTRISVGLVELSKQLVLLEELSRSCDPIVSFPSETSTIMY
jgi:hypothetical protein